MKTSIAILSASVASAMASPFPISSKHCNVAPSASVNGKVQPYHNGKADTAIDCQTYCASDDSCKSFAFGLAKGAHEPSCLLFKVAAAKVPARKDGLHVFDRECAADRVPTSAPTTGQPWGTVPKKVLARRGTKCNCAASGSANADVQPFKTATAATAKDCQVLAEADTSCMSFLFGLSDDSKSPVCKLYKVAASSIPARSDKLFVFDKGCSSKQVPTTAPTEDAPRGLVPGASKVAKDAKATKVTKVEGKKTEQEGDYEVPSSKPKTTKVQKSQPKVTKVANGEGNKVQYAEPEATQQAEKPKPKSTKIVNSKAKATKAAKVENEENQYAEPAKSSKTKTKAAEVNNDNNSKAQDTKDKAEDNNQTKVTKVKDTKVKATKVAKVENENENVQYAEPSKVSNTKTKVTKVAQVNVDININDEAKDTKAKATKVENQEQKATKVAKVESNKDTNNKDSKVESPKTLVTKVRNNEQQATQAAKVDGKSECKTTKVKVSNNQAKATQAY
ncbi:hypothetical protein FSHL1_012468 [Fusarium sambucinum]